MNTESFKDAAFLYVQNRPSSTNTIKVIALMLEGYDLDHIIRNRKQLIPNLSCATITKIYYRWRNNI
ncbi:hypothetical protein C1N27_07315 [Vibrio diazotrophicus]|nr:hypothetical protein C1N27_07315 [Vibrio diazotrophicus]